MLVGHDPTIYLAVSTLLEKTDADAWRVHWTPSLDQLDMLAHRDAVRWAILDDRGVDGAPPERVVELLRDRGVHGIVVLGSSPVPGCVPLERAHLARTSLLQALFDARGPRAPLLPIRVLVVDDDPISLATIPAMLGADYACATAPGGHAAIDWLEEKAADCVLSDIVMAEGSGIDLYEWVAMERPQLRERFVLMTGHPRHTQAARLFARASLPILHKPLQTASLRELLERVCAPPLLVR